MKVLLETFLNNLPNCVSRELIDKVSTRFTLFQLPFLQGWHLRYFDLSCSQLFFQIAHHLYYQAYKHDFVKMWHFLLNSLL